MAAASWCRRATAHSCAQTMAVVQVTSRGISVKPVDTSCSKSGVASSVRPTKQYPAGQERLVAQGWPGSRRRSGRRHRSAPRFAPGADGGRTARPPRPRAPPAPPMSLPTARAWSLSRSPVARSPAKVGSPGPGEEQLPATVRQPGALDERAHLLDPPVDLQQVAHLHAGMDPV